MKKLVSFLLAMGLLLPYTSFAAVAPSQVIIGRSVIGVSGATNTFIAPLSLATNSGSLTQAWPVAGVIKNLRAYSDTAPGGTGTWTVTLTDNATLEALTCTITSAITSCSDLTHTYTPTVGTSQIDVKFAPTNSPATATIYFSFDFVPTNANESVVLSGTGGNTLNATLDKFTAIGTQQGVGGVENVSQQVFAEAGTIDNMYVQLNASPGSGTSYNFTLRQNAATSTQTCTIANLATTCNDLTHPLTITVGDLFSMRTDPVGTPTTRTMGNGNRFVSGIAGDFLMFSDVDGAGSPHSATATDYLPLSGSFTGGPAPAAIEASSTEYADTSIVKGFYVHLNTATGAAKSRTFTLRKNAGTTTCAVIITNGSTGFAQCSPVIQFAAGDTWDYSDVPNGSPATTVVQIGTILQPPQPPIFSLTGGNLTVKGGNWTVK